MDKLIMLVLILILLVEVAQFINSVATYRWNSRVLQDSADQYRRERDKFLKELNAARQQIATLKMSQEFWKVHEASGDYAISSQGTTVLPKGWREMLTSPKAGAQ